jgi:hypothetical protein
VRDLRCEELGLVTTFRGPGTRIVVRHEVDHIEVMGSMPKIDMLERPLASRKR